MIKYSGIKTDKTEAAGRPFENFPLRYPGRTFDGGNRNADRAEGNGRRIGNQANSRRIQRLKTKSDEQSGRDRDGSAETGGAF